MEEPVKPPVPASRPRLLSFAKGTKKEGAQSGAEGAMFEELMSVAAFDAFVGLVEWLGDSDASSHVCNDLSLM